MTTKARKIVRIGPRMYSIDDPAMARVIYGISSPLPKSKWYDAWGDPRIPNHNLFSARDRVVHGLMRRKVASMYSMSTIKSYEPYVDSCAALLLKRFDEFAESGETFDLQQWMQCYAFDVIGEITVSLVLACLPDCINFLTFITVRQTSGFLGIWRKRCRQHHARS